MPARWLKALCISCARNEGSPSNGGLCSSCAPFTNPRPR